MSKMIEWAKENMSRDDFQYEVLEAFSVIYITIMENNDAKTGKLVFDKLKITLELTDEQTT